MQHTKLHFDDVIPQEDERINDGFSSMLCFVGKTLSSGHRIR